MSFARAAIKRPDVLIMNHSLAGHDAASLGRLRNQLSELLPEMTQIYLESHFDSPSDFDMSIEIRGGRVDGVAQIDTPNQEDTISDDLSAISVCLPLPRSGFRSRRVVRYSPWGKGRMQFICACQARAN